MTRKERNEYKVAQAAAVLMAAGYLPSGETRSETVRVPTTACPVYGVTGGELRTFGGRARFSLPGTDRMVTVGPVTTCFYRYPSKEVGATDFHNEDTSDLEALGAYLAKIAG